MNNIIASIIVDSYNIIARKLKDSENILDVLSELIIIDIPGIVELELITSEYNVIDLNILRVKIRA